MAPPPPALVVEHRRVSRVLAARTLRRTFTSAVACAVVFGVTAATSALSYASSFPTVAVRQQLAATTSADTGLSVVLGPISAIDTVGGYTVYKGFVFLTTVGALWGLLAATRLLRGEEDAGRWQLLLAGDTRPARATLATVAGLGASIVLLFTVTALIVLAAGRSPDLAFGAGEAVLYAMSVTVPIAVFAGVGALTSQVGRSRRTATGLAIGVFAVAFVLRMLGDVGGSLRGLLWITPFGWTELMEPFTGNHWWPLAPALLTTVALVAAAIGLAGRRDVGDGLLEARDVAAPRSVGLRSAIGLAGRLQLPVLVGWFVGVVASALVLGFVAQLTTADPPASMSDMLDRFGARGSFARQYMGVAFLLIATVVALIPAGQLGAAADEETSGRLVHVLAGPVRRSRWLFGRLLLTAVAVIASASAAGVVAWAAARAQGVDLDLPAMVGAGINVVPVALVCLGIGAVVFAVRPRLAAPAVYAIVIWSLVVDLVGSLVAGVGWLDRLSVFHAMALAPADPLQPLAMVVTTLVGGALCAVAIGLFARRDVRAG